jgi:hypothetical protein
MTTLWTLTALLLAFWGMAVLTLAQEKMQRIVAIDRRRARMLRRRGIAGLLAASASLWMAYGPDAGMAVTAGFCLFASAGIAAILIVGRAPRTMLRWLIAARFS